MNGGTPDMVIGIEDTATHDEFTYTALVFQKHHERFIHVEGMTDDSVAYLLYHSQQHLLCGGAVWWQQPHPCLSDTGGVSEDAIFATRHEKTHTQK